MTTTIEAAPAAAAADTTRPTPTQTPHVCGCCGGGGKTAEGACPRCAGSGQAPADAASTAPAAPAPPKRGRPKKEPNQTAPTSLEEVETSVPAPVQRTQAAPASWREQKRAERAADEARISAPLDPKDLRHRPGYGGKGLEYLRWSDVVQVTNEAFGGLGWATDVRELHVTRCEQVEVERTNQRTGEVVKTRAWQADAWALVEVCPADHPDARRTDVGYGSSAPLPDRGQAEEFAVKTAVSDAQKRALRTYGPRFGLALYVLEDEREEAGMTMPEEHAVRPVAPTILPPRPTQQVPPAPAAPAGQAAPAATFPPRDPIADVRDAVAAAPSDAPIPRELGNALAAAAKRLGCTDVLAAFRAVGVAPPTAPTGAQARAFLAHVGSQGAARA